MKNALWKWIVCAAGAGGIAMVASAAPVSGTFIQLNREVAERTVSDWRAEIAQMQKIGIRTLIVQHAGEQGVTYFQSEDPAYAEAFPALENIFAAVQGTDMEIQVGLHQDAFYWTQITRNGKALRDYFLVRLAQNENLVQRLHTKFAGEKAWMGYYIPDEIDDLNWRTGARQEHLRTYLESMVGVIKKHDPDRSIGISMFFRKRTSPELTAKNLLAVAGSAQLDYMMIQDGVGAGDIPDRYLPTYFEALLTAWSTQETGLWCVLEAFKVTSAPDEPFAAQPAPVDRFQRQLSYASGFAQTVLFTYGDYMDPDRGPGAKALYDALAGNMAVSRPELTNKVQ